MKQLKFDHELAQMILAGHKTTTFRVMDDKDLKAGDEIRIVDKTTPDTPSSWTVVGEAVITEAYEKPIKDLDEHDYDGHEKYLSPVDMLMQFRQYYGDDLSAEQKVKIIRFDFTPYPQPKLYYEAIGEQAVEEAVSVSMPAKVKLYGDGGSRGNPGPSAYGYVVYDEQDKVLKRGSKYLGVTTNNQAEYHSLKAGLSWCQEHHIKQVAVFMDSLLVINQIKGIFKVKNRDLWPLFDAIKDLVKTFEKVTFTHVPRELNKAADAEVNKALDAVEN